MGYKVPSARGSVQPDVPFGGTVVIDIPQPDSSLPPLPGPALIVAKKDREIRAMMRDALRATNVFDSVQLGDLPEDGDGRFYASIEPEDTDFRADWKDKGEMGVTCDSRVLIWLAGNESDRQIRDEYLEVMLYHCLNLFQWSTFGGRALRDWSQVDRATWEKVKTIEKPLRKVRVVFKYRFQVKISFDTSQ